jgi:alanyl-tRNA synthetase
VVKYRTVTLKGQPQYHLVLNRTPFYPEGGGQVGDTGLAGIQRRKNPRTRHQKRKRPGHSHGGKTAAILDRIPPCMARWTPANAGSPKATTRPPTCSTPRCAKCWAITCSKKARTSTTKPCVSTSSISKSDRRRTGEIEQFVNEKIRENIALEEARNLPIEEAKKSGAMMLFGEKYGETVRMITFDPAYSRELCGGCHVSHTGKIGYFKITAETAVAAGVRRIEADHRRRRRGLRFRYEKRERRPSNRCSKSKELTKGRERPAGGKQTPAKRNRTPGAGASQWPARRPARQSSEQMNGVSISSATVLPINDANAIKTLAFELERETRQCRDCLRLRERRETHRLPSKSATAW